MSNIHPTAIISPKAKLGDNVTVAPYAIIHDDVIIGDECQIGPHAVICDGARLGSRVRIFQGASVSNIPQDLSFDNEYSVFEIGDNTTIREYCTLHRGTKASGKSSVGKNCLLMAYVHVAHDDIVGDNCVIANSVHMGGHVHLGNHVTVGGGTVIHQFCHVGSHCMIGGGHKVTQDVPPFILAAGWPIEFNGLNVIGLRRRGFTNEDITLLKSAYSYLYNSSYNVTQAKEKIKAELSENKYVAEVIEFLNASKRGIVGK